VSRDILGEELKDDSLTGKREPYEPGKLGYPEGILDEILELYLDIPEEDFSETRDNLEPVIGRAAYKLCLYPRDEFNPNALLDGLLHKLYAKATDSYLTSGGHLVSAVMHILFNLQYNDFLLDVSPYPTTYPNGLNSIACDLRGEPDRYMKVTCIGDIKEVGIGLDYCDLSYKGTVVNVACGAKHSILTLQGSFKYFGMVSEDSEFHVPAHYTPKLSTLMKRCTVYADSDDIDLETLPEKFFLKENTLRVPDGAGGWKEVIPLE